MKPYAMSVFLLLFCLPAVSGETKSFSLHSGAAAVEAPADWRLDEHDAYKTDILSDPERKFCTLSFLGPNPAAAGAIDEYARLTLAAFFPLLGSDGKITEAREETIGGRSGFVYKYEIQFNQDEKLLGEATVFEENGYAVLVNAASFENEALYFLEDCRRIVSTYAIDPEGLKANAGPLGEYGEGYLRKLREHAQLRKR